MSTGMSTAWCSGFTMYRSETELKDKSSSVKVASFRSLSRCSLAGKEKGKVMVSRTAHDTGQYVTQVALTSVTCMQLCASPWGDSSTVFVMSTTAHMLTCKE